MKNTSHNSYGTIIVIAITVIASLILDPTNQLEIQVKEEKIEEANHLSTDSTLTQMIHSLNESKRSER